MTSIYGRSDPNASTDYASYWEFPEVHEWLCLLVAQVRNVTRHFWDLSRTSGCLAGAHRRQQEFAQLVALLGRHRLDIDGVLLLHLVIDAAAVLEAIGRQHARDLRQIHQGLSFIAQGEAIVEDRVALS